MKKIFITILAAAFVLILNITAYASLTLDSVNVDYQKGTITISGSLGSGNSGLRVSLEIVDTAGKTAYVDQLTSGVKGSFSKEFKLNRYFKTDTYTVKVIGGGSNASTTFSVDQTNDIFSISNVSITGASDDKVYEGTALGVDFDYFSSFGYNMGTVSYTWQAAGGENGTFYDIENVLSSTFSINLSDAQALVQKYPTEFSTKQFYIRCIVKAKTEVSVNYSAPVISNNIINVTLLPVASSVTISGKGTNAEPLKGSYTYYDFQDKAEKNSELIWLKSSSENGIYTEIATGYYYITSSSDAGSYIRFSVTPKADGYVKMGNTVLSANYYYVQSDQSGGYQKLSGGNSSGGGGSMISIPKTEPEILAPPVDVINKFIDLDKAYWAFSDISEVLERNHASGMNDTEFAPESNVTRAQFCKLILSTLNKELVPYNNTFSDVRAEDWFSSVVETAYSLKLVSGYEGAFNPNANITREEMTKIIIEAYKLINPDTEIPPSDKIFTDAESISEWAASYITSSVSLGLITGMPDGSFLPHETATRAQAVVIINRLYKLID